MQTFLPWPDFRASARDLDTARLGKQRVETLQLLRSRLHHLKGEKAGWYSHPARVMWHGHESMLTVYGLVICDEWLDRGYEDTCFSKILNSFEEIATIGGTWDPRFYVPAWFNDPRLFESHRAALLRKKYSHYSDYEGTCDASQPYFWPGEPEEFHDQTWWIHMQPIAELLDVVGSARKRAIERRRGLQ